MKTITIAGNIGKDAEVRSTQAGDKITSWSVAVDDGWGDNKRTLWFDCGMWGKRGESLAPYIRKGGKITVSGELTTREHEGKTYLKVTVSQVALQGGERQETGGGPTQQSTGAPGMDDGIPFMAEWRV